jgi:hypothetical protein
MRLALVRDVNDLIDPPTPRLSLRTWQSKRKPIKFLIKWLSSFCKRKLASVRWQSAWSTEMGDAAFRREVAKTGFDW